MSSTVIRIPASRAACATACPRAFVVGVPGAAGGVVQVVELPDARDPGQRHLGVGGAGEREVRVGVQAPSHASTSGPATTRSPRRRRACAPAARGGTRASARWPGRAASGRQPERVRRQRHAARRRTRSAPRRPRPRPPRRPAPAAARRARTSTSPAGVPATPRRRPAAPGRRRGRRRRPGSRPARRARPARARPRSGCGRTASPSGSPRPTGSPRRGRPPSRSRGASPARPEPRRATRSIRTGSNATSGEKDSSVESTVTPSRAARRRAPSTTSSTSARTVASDGRAGVEPGDDLGRDRVGPVRRDPDPADRRAGPGPLGLLAGQQDGLGEREHRVAAVGQLAWCRRGRRRRGSPGASARAARCRCRPRPRRAAASSGPAASPRPCSTCSST